MPLNRTIKRARTARLEHSPRQKAGGWHDVFAFANVFHLLRRNRRNKHRHQPLESVTSSVRIPAPKNKRTTSKALGR
jgi:hypothetical protein